MWFYSPLVISSYQKLALRKNKSSFSVLTNCTIADKRSRLGVVPKVHMLVRLSDFRKDVIIIGAPFISLSSTEPRGRRGLTQYGQHRDVDERSCIKIFCSITPLHTFDKALASSGGTSTPSCGYSYDYRDLMRMMGGDFSHDVQVDEYVDPNNLVDYATLARINGEMITDERYTSTTPASPLQPKTEYSQTLLRHESHTRRPYVCPLYLSCHPRQYRTLYCIDPLSG
ncbi:hypothetical protein BJV77DRAFT_808847 [Russula vinacea]|nr:hypothetical protein BJV77DRAFT_808847 [Russula vinacea]